MDMDAAVENGGTKKDQQQKSREVRFITSKLAAFGNNITTPGNMRKVGKKTERVNSIAAEIKRQSYTV